MRNGSEMKNNRREMPRVRRIIIIGRALAVGM
jgi:hypothetical protein